MKITVIHGQGHKGITYKMTKTVLDFLAEDDDEINEFFLPKDGPGFCVGCNTCFMKGEEFCPGADKVQPIIKSMEESEIIILDSPNYVMEMSGNMKNLMDHFAYRWITHRPHANMFKKVGLTISSSAGAPPSNTVKSMAKQLKWMGVPKVYKFPLISNALNISTISSRVQFRATHIFSSVSCVTVSSRPSFAMAFVVIPAALQSCVLLIFLSIISFHNLL